MRKVLIGLLLAVVATVALYAQEPARFARGIEILRGNLYVGTGSIVFEGSTGDASELTVSVTDPTADRTLTIPNSSGTLVHTGSTPVFSTAVEIADDTVFSLGNDNDQAFVNRSSALTANTVLAGVILGTPVTPALAANSLIVSNVTADGDLLLATQTGGNSSGVLFADASAQTTSIMVTGVATARFDSTDVLFPDDYILTVGTGASLAYKDDATNANTTVTNVILGTPVTPAVAADTLLLFNQIADGDLLIGTQTGGNSQAALFVDGSAGTVNVYGAGVRQLQVDASSVNVGVAGTTLGRIEISGNTSGTISIFPLAAAGTYSLTLPPDDGDAGEQLQTDGSGVMTWEGAGSRREFKDVHDAIRPADALRAILDATVYRFHYKRPGATTERITTTGDYATEYVGVMADDAPWAMHHAGRILNPVNTAGYTFAAIQALHAEIVDLKAEVARLKAR